MFTPEQAAGMSGHLAEAIGMLILAAAALIVALLMVGVRKLNQIGGETTGAKARGEEIRENTRRIANGRSVHHESEALGESSGAATDTGA